MKIKFAGIDLDIKKKITKTERELIKEYEEFFLRNKSRLEAIYSAAGENATKVQLRHIAKLYQLEQNILAEVESLAETSVNKNEQLLSSIYETNYLLTASTLEERAGLTFGFQTISREQLIKSINNPFLKTNWQKLSVNNHLKSYKQLIGIINEGFVNNLGYVETSKLLKQAIYGSGVRNTRGLAYKTLRIVRTESHRVNNLARNDCITEAQLAAEKLGIEMDKVWDANNTRDPRDNHSRMDGQVANEDGEFLLTTEAGSKILVAAPGNTGIASEDIHCGCTIRVEIRKKEE